MAEVFSVEGLLDMELVVEDPAALMLYESQLMSCIMEDHHSGSSLSVPVWSESDPPPPPPPPQQPAHLPEKPADGMASGGGGGNPNSSSSSSAESLSAYCGQPRVITFGFENYYEDPDDKYGSGGVFGAHLVGNNNNNNKRSASYAQEHVQVERRRREKLAQRFLQLTALVPGLNTKMDKASIIEEATKYIKQLQERVKLLEQHTTKEKTEEITTTTTTTTTLSVQNTQTADDNGSSSSTEDNKISSSSSSASNSSSVNEQLEIDVKVSEDRDHNMLTIRIHSKLDFNLISKIISEVEKLNLKLLSSNVMPFGKHAMDTTLVAKMEDAFCMTLEQLVKHLQVYLQQLSHL